MPASGGRKARSQLRPFIAWVRSQIRASGKTEQIAAATQVSTVLSGMLRSDTRDSLSAGKPGIGIAQQAFPDVAEDGSPVGPFDAILAYLRRRTPGGQ